MNVLHNPMHPGDILQDIWPEGLTLTAAANQLGITRSLLSKILNGEAGISSDVAVRLHSWGGISAERWMRMQLAYDIWLEGRHSRSNEAIFQFAA